VFSNKNFGIAVTAMAVAVGMMLGVAGPGRAQDKAADPPKAPAKNWKDNAEYELAVQCADTKQTPAQHLTCLEKWKTNYPATEYLDERQGMFLQTYTDLKQARQAFDMAQEILKSQPNNYGPIGTIVTFVTKIQPAPTPADLDTGEKYANLLIDNPDSVKPPATSNADWDKTKAQVKPFAESVLLAIYGLRKDDKRAVDDLRKFITRDPNHALAAYTLGLTMIRLDTAAKKPEDYPAGFYQIARSLDVTGPGALPANQVAAVQDYLKKGYSQFHGSAEGIEDLMAVAKSGPFPPSGFKIKSNVDIENEKQAALAAEIAKDPIKFLWATTIKGGLMMGGDAFWEANVKEAGLPGPDPNDKSDKPEERFFKASIISMEPANKPKVITVGIERADVADAKLEFEKPLDGKMDAGEMIEFHGAAKEWNHDQKMPVITFDIADPKTDLKGWTGKNTPAKGPAKGPAAPKGPAATKGTAPKQ
jgi:tetratricopeptide (TPR) repeat protein